MTNQEILEKAIAKAIDGGFSFKDIWGALEPWWKYEIYDGDEDIVFYHESIHPNPWRMNFSTLIFSHDFAKALWGEHQEPFYQRHIIRSQMPGYVDTTHPLHTSEDFEMIMEEDWRCFECKKVIRGQFSYNNSDCYLVLPSNKGWKGHLIEMVVSPDPIKYLGDNI